MMKKLIIFAAFMAASVPTVAQVETTMSKQEFIDSQIELFGQVDEMKAKVGVQQDEMMKSKLTPELYADYKKRREATEQTEVKRVADCLGISTDKVKSIEESIDSKTLVESVSRCSSKLPESVTLVGGDWSKAAALAEYNNCNEQFIADKSGIPVEKYKQCAAEQEEF